ncbi:MAG: hypothetical protein ACR2MG_11085 [Pyrinomonadaceae bacterium]
MKTEFIRASVLLLALAFLSGGEHSPVSAENREKRVRFQVTTVSENENERRVLAQTTVEGLPGTDFNINLQTGNFKMQARFLSDLVAEDKLKLRANLNTRRFYGYSPINLPLYEEDSQKHALQVGFNETVVLLPFGRNGGADTLKIEITPTLFSVSRTDEESQKLKINFDKQIPSGEIFVQASKIPHEFEVEAVLLADGQEIARGAADCLLEEEREIILQPNPKAKITDQIFKAKLTIDKFSRSRPKDFAEINFGLYRQSGGEIQTAVSNGAGMLTLGDELVYQLDEIDSTVARKYELKFKIGLKENEKEK